MNIAYSCNDYYVSQTGISLISLFENNKDVDRIIIYLVSKGISEENIKILDVICNRYGRQLKVIEFDDIAYDLKLSTTGRHIATVYTKVFFPRIYEVDKMIYFDSDTIIVGNLQELWDMPLDDVYMGVVETLPSKFYKELGLPKDAPFFNDGMAICNVDYCRKHDLIGQVLKIVDDFDGNPPTLSEGALNKVCFGKVKYISPKYNLLAGLLYFCNLDVDYMSNVFYSYSKEELSDACSHPIMIHFLTAFYNRPWFTPCTHPYKNLYFKYKLISPWRDVPEKHRPLPARIRAINWCYMNLGIRRTEKLRLLLKKANSVTKRFSVISLL